MRSSKVRYLDIAVLLSLLILFLIFLVLDIIPWLNNQSGKTVVFQDNCIFRMYVQFFYFKTTVYIFRMYVQIYNFKSTISRLLYIPNVRTNLLFQDYCIFRMYVQIYYFMTSIYSRCTYKFTISRLLHIFRMYVQIYYFKTTVYSGHM